VARSMLIRFFTFDVHDFVLFGSKCIIKRSIGCCSYLETRSLIAFSGIHLLLFCFIFPFSPSGLPTFRRTREIAAIYINIAITLLN
jgi:hypothetical protein